MKFAISVVAAIVLSIGLGLAAGAITTNIRVTQMKEHLEVYRKGDLSEDYAQLNVEKEDSSGTPRFTMTGGEFHEFGTMETDETKSHTFVIRNVGDAAGVVKLLQTSCKCTTSELLGKGVLLQPGEQQDIELSWEPKKDEPEFEQTAKIQTDDPDQEIIELRIRGRVIERVCPVPRALRLAGVPNDKAAEHTLRVFAYRQKDFEILSGDFSQSENVDKLAVNWRPMTEEEISEERGAQSGAIVTITTKDGLPYGAFQQGLVLKTNADGEYASLKVPVSVSVRSDVRISSADRSHRFITEVNLLEMGQISDGKPAETTLSFFVAPGENIPENIEMKVLEAETFPKGGIIAKFGQPVNRGKARLFPLKITIPDEQKPIVLEGSEDGEFGLIVIETNIESAKRIEIYVQYKVVK